MNTGAFGEGFPYSNFHDLNMNWIIKIAKDFLDQYTHIQEVIENGETSLTELTEEGLQALTDKKEELEGLLDAWYTEHSEDIANELVTAVASAISSFSTRANEIGLQVIESIPDDYTELADEVRQAQSDIHNLIYNTDLYDVNVDFKIGTYNSSGVWTDDAEYHSTDLIDLTDVLKLYKYTETTGTVYLTYFNSSNTFIRRSSNNVAGLTAPTIPEGSKYVCISHKPANVSDLKIKLIYPYNNVFKKGEYITNSKVIALFDTDTTSMRLVENGYVFYKQNRYTIPAGVYSWETVTDSQCMLVYDTLDNTAKLIGYTNYTNTQIIAFIFWKASSVITVNPLTMSKTYEYYVDGKHLPDNTEVFIRPIYDSSLTVFDYDNSFIHQSPINIVKTENGYVTDFDITSLKYSETTAVYVSAKFGNNNYDGSACSPYATINRALQDTPDTIYLFDEEIICANNVTYSSPVNLICKNNNATVVLGTADGYGDGYTIHFDGGVYMENITILGGKGFVSANTNNAVYAFNHCRFTKSSRNGLTFKGRKAFLYRCTADYNTQDGYNYHKQNDNNIPDCIVEIYCTAHHNGTYSEYSDNGSSVHDGGAIIRLGCEYYLNHGGNVADSEAQSYNFDIYAHDSTSRNNEREIYNSDYFCMYGTVMWLYNTISSGSKYALATNQSTCVVNTTTDYADEYKSITSGSTVNIITE